MDNNVGHEGLRDALKLRLRLRGCLGNAGAWVLGLCAGLCSWTPWKCWRMLCRDAVHFYCYLSFGGRLWGAGGWLVGFCAGLCWLGGCLGNNGAWVLGLCAGPCSWLGLGLF